MIRPPLWGTLLAIGCVHPDQPLDTKESPAPDSVDTGIDRSGWEAGVETDTGAETDTGPPPDTHDTGETDSPADTDTGAVVCEAYTLPLRFVAAGMWQTCGIHTDGCAECWRLGEEESSGNPRDTSSYYWEGEDRPPPSSYQSIVMFNTKTGAD